MAFATQPAGPKLVEPGAACCGAVNESDGKVRVGSRIGFASASVTADAAARWVGSSVHVAMTAAFGRRCGGCPLRHRTTTSRSGRSLHISDHDDLLVAARQQAATGEFAAVYPRRSLVERSIAWLVKDGHRRCRYRGVKRNQLGWSLRVAAVNLTRLLNLGLHHNRGWAIPAIA